MSGLEAAIALVIEIVCGAAGGMALGRGARSISLGEPPTL